MNGELKPWPGPLSRARRARLDGEDEASVRGSTDAEMFGARWHTCLRQTRPADGAGALREALGAAGELALAHGGTIQANGILAGRSGFVAVRYGEPQESPSLY